MPSNEVLQYHWLRCTWVRLLWEPADQQIVVVRELNEFGWMVSENQMSVVLDTHENVAAVPNRLELLIGMQMLNRMFLHRMKVCQSIQSMWTLCYQCLCCNVATQVSFSRNKKLKTLHHWRQNSYVVRKTCVTYCLKILMFALKK